jgi:hypothetical protein
VPFWPSLSEEVLGDPDVFVMATSYRKHGQLPPTRRKIRREQIPVVEVEQARLKFFGKHLTNLG